MPTVRPDGRESGSISVAEIAVPVAALLDRVPEGTDLDPRTASLLADELRARGDPWRVRRLSSPGPCSTPAAGRRGWRG